MVTKTVEDRFWSKVQIAEPDDCWTWKGRVRPAGYGYFDVRSGERFYPRHAHRVAYELTHGALPSDLVVDHLCRNTLCVNPAHMEPVTPGENTRRMLVAHRPEHCPQGHPYDEANTYMHGNHRLCKACSAERSRKWRAQRKEQKFAGKLDGGTSWGDDEW